MMRKLCRIEGSFASWRIALAFILNSVVLFNSTGVYAQATVVVPADEGYAWEVRDFDMFPRKKVDDGVSVAQINAWLSAHRGMKSIYSVCFLDFLQNDEVTSTDDDTRKEIAKDLSEYPNSFALDWNAGPNANFLVRVAALQNCPSSEPSMMNAASFLVLIITDRGGGIKHINATQWSFIRLFARDDGHINILGCFACGEVAELAWDSVADRIYQIDIGH